ncbi:MAG: hypothetical protein ACLPID_02860 [Beijerinckiaceae bacterium]
MNVTFRSFASMMRESSGVAECITSKCELIRDNLPAALHRAAHRKFDAIHNARRPAATPLRPAPKNARRRTQLSRIADQNYQQHLQTRQKKIGSGLRLFFSFQYSALRRKCLALQYKSLAN